MLLVRVGVIDEARRRERLRPVLARVGRGFAHTPQLISFIKGLRIAPEVTFGHRVERERDRAGPRLVNLRLSLRRAFMHQRAMVFGRVGSSLVYSRIPVARAPEVGGASPVSDVAALGPAFESKGIRLRLYRVGLAGLARVQRAPAPPARLAVCVHAEAEE